MKLDYFLTQIISKCIKNLNVRHKTIKLLEEIRSSKLSDIALNNIFLDMSPWAGKTKEENK